MDKLAALAAFVAVVQDGGFAPAARRLGLATSSLTRQLNALEANLGVPLLNRSTRRVSLTDAGARYLEDARRILDDVADADRAIGDASGAPRGLVRLSVPPAFGRLHVAPALPAFLQACPDVEIDVVATDRVVDLVEDRVDVAVRLGVLASSSLIARTLAPHRRVLCASPRFLATYGEPRHPKDIDARACLVFEPGSTEVRWVFRRAGAVHRLEPKGRLRANASELLRAAALGDAGLLVMPTWLVGADLRAGRLVRVLAEWDVDHGAEAGTIAAVYLANRRGSGKVRALIDHLAGRIGTPAYWEIG